MTDFFSYRSSRICSSAIRVSAFIVSPHAPYFDKHSVPHNLHLLPDILVGNAVEVTLCANAHMVCATKLHLLTVAETVHSLRERSHVGKFLALEDVPSRATLVLL